MQNDRVTTILSIQSLVAYGHVGNSAVLFPLMRLGVEVWPVVTVHFSNHTGYPSWRGPQLSGGDIGEIVRGLDERGVLGRCDAVLSGYQGRHDIAAAILDAVALVKERNHAAVYCCDPVLGDTGRGTFVRPEIPDLIRDRVIPAADIATPNQYELGLLTGMGTASLDEVVAAAETLRSAGPDIVLVTSVRHEAAPEDTIDMVVVDAEGAWSVTTPALPQTFQGAGDLAAALFLVHLLGTRDTAEALVRTADVVFSVLDATAAAGSAELRLVAAQDQLVRPTHQFSARRLR
jgi:pyridoxine kinase